MYSQVVIKVLSGGTSVLDFDQLNFLRQEGFIFKGFHVAAISFPSHALSTRFFPHK